MPTPAGRMSTKKQTFLPDLKTKKSGVIKEVFLDDSNSIVQVSLEGKSAARTKRADYIDLPNGHWDFGDHLMNPRDMSGFVYLIRDNHSRKFYIGKKSYRGKGKLNKGKESNWKWYISSSKELSKSIQICGKEGFDFYCIEEYKYTGSVSFAETWSLCHVEALTNRDRWHNGLVGKVSWTVKEAVSDRHKFRLTKILSMYD
jgi:hypothetical protein